MVKFLFSSFILSTIGVILMLLEDPNITGAVVGVNSNFYIGGSLLMVSVLLFLSGSMIERRFQGRVIEVSPGKAVFSYSGVLKPSPNLNDSYAVLYTSTKGGFLGNFYSGFNEIEVKEELTQLAIDHPELKINGKMLILYPRSSFSNKNTLHNTQTLSRYVREIFGKVEPFAIEYRCVESINHISELEENDPKWAQMFFKPKTGDFNFFTMDDQIKGNIIENKLIKKPR